MKGTIKAILIGVVVAIISAIVIKKFVNKNGQAATPAS
jgi:hypothetical protein